MKTFEEDSEPPLPLVESRIHRSHLLWIREHFPAPLQLLPETVVLHPELHDPFNHVDLRRELHYAVDELPPRHLAHSPGGLRGRLAVADASSPLVGEPLDDLCPEVLQSRPDLDLDRAALHLHDDVHRPIAEARIGPAVLYRIWPTFRDGNGAIPASGWLRLPGM